MGQTHWDSWRMARISLHSCKRASPPHFSPNCPSSEGGQFYLLSGLLCQCLKEMLCWDPPSFLTAHSTAAQEATS